MEKIIITAETGSDIPKELAEKYNIHLIPMHVTFGDITKDDGTFSPYEIYEYYDREHKVPTTSGCNPQEFENVFNALCNKYPDCHIIHMAYSAVTTCSYQNAIVASEGYDNVSVIDTKLVTVGQCAAVIRFAEKLHLHPEWTAEEAVSAAKKIIRSVKMCFIPKNLDYLRAGGRVSNATALCGNILGIHPKIELIDGYLKATKKYRGRTEKVVLSLISDYLNEHSFDETEIWMGATVGFPKDLKTSAIKSAKKLGFKNVCWITAGGVITAHGGPDGFCIAGFTK